ncbi:MAG: FecR domain-containing protein [Chloroflexi bacterium]|nr:FecR domain-containing protein [Chloroflexota bacterium]
MGVAYYHLGEAYRRNGQFREARDILKAFVAAVVVVVVGWGIYAAISSTAPLRPYAIAKVTSVRGEVRLTQRDADETSPQVKTTPAELGQPLTADAEIRTLNDKSSVEVTFTDGTRLTLGGNSEAVLGMQSDKRGASLKRGDIFLCLSAEELTFEVRTPLGSAIAREASWLVEHDPTAGEVTVTVVKGEVSFGQIGAQITVARGQTSTAVRGQTPGAPSSVDLRTLLSRAWIPTENIGPAWPCVGGNAEHSGRSPFRLALNGQGKTAARVLNLFAEGLARHRDDRVAGPVVNAAGEVIALRHEGATARSELVVMGKGKDGLTRMPLPAPFAGEPALAPDGAIIVPLADGRIWSVRLGQAGQARARANDAPATSVALAPSGELWIGTQKGVEVRRREADETAASIRFEIGPLLAPVAFGPEQVVFAFSANGSIATWNTAAGVDRPVVQEAGHGIRTAPVVFGKSVAAVSEQGYLVWRDAVGVVRSTKVPAGAVAPPAVGPDGRLLVVSLEGVLHVLADGTLQTTGARARGGERVFVQPIVDADGRVILVDEAGTVFVFASPAAREPLAIIPTGVRSPRPYPAMAPDGTLYILGNDGRLAAVGGKVLE